MKLFIDLIPRLLFIFGKKLGSLELLALLVTTTQTGTILGRFVSYAVMLAIKTNQ